MDDYELGIEFAQQKDRDDPLQAYRQQFHFPISEEGAPLLYLCGNSLGLQPKSAIERVEEVMIDWRQMGVDGHFHADKPWTEYHDLLVESTSSIVGAKPEEVTVMNTLTVNLHLMLVSFFRPKGKRKKILIEADAFPSDKYAIESQLRFHQLDPAECLVQLRAREGEECLRIEDIEAAIKDIGEELALVLFGNTNYYTGQFFDMKAISKAGHAVGSYVGFDCAHGAGNLPLELDASECDFAIWCNYKYLNGGPGALGGVFINERHFGNPAIPRFEGWWGYNRATRFKMEDGFDSIPGVEGWQLSNPPILSLATIKASLDIHHKIGMDALRKKSIQLTGYLEYLVNTLDTQTIQIITPSDPEQRGCQLSIRVFNSDERLFDLISAKGVVADWREPDVIRVAPAPAYNSFKDVHRFYVILQEALIEFRALT